MDCEIESILIDRDNVGIENGKILDNIGEHWDWILVWDIGSRKVWKFLDIFGINN